MIIHPLYQYFPAMGVDNIGARQGYFKNLDTFCPMAFDKSESVSSLCSRDKDDSLFVWSDQTIDELKKYALNRGIEQGWWVNWSTEGPA